MRAAVVALLLAACGPAAEEPTDTRACAAALAACNCEPRSYMARVTYDGREGTPLVWCYAVGTGPLTRPSTSMWCLWSPQYDACFPPR